MTLGCSILSLIPNETPERAESLDHVTDRQEKEMAIQHSKLTSFIRSDVELVALYMMCVQINVPNPNNKNIDEMEIEHRGKASYEDVVGHLAKWIYENFPGLPSVLPYKGVARWSGGSSLG